MRQIVVPILLRRGAKKLGLIDKDYDNLADNSVWAGMSGSDSSDDFVAPTGYIRFQDTAHMETIDIGDGHLACRIEGSNQRSMFIGEPTEDLVVGEPYNISLFHDTIAELSGGRLLGVSAGGGTFTRQMERPSSGTSGRIDCVLVPDIPRPQLRIGLGITTNASGEFTLSRLQITKGSLMRPYKETL